MVWVSVTGSQLCRASYYYRSAWTRHAPRSLPFRDLPPQTQVRALHVGHHIVELQSGDLGDPQVAAARQADDG